MLSPHKPFAFVSLGRFLATKKTDDCCSCIGNWFECTRPCKRRIVFFYGCSCSPLWWEMFLDKRQNTMTTGDMEQCQCKGEDCWHSAMLTLAWSNLTNNRQTERAKDRERDRQTTVSKMEWLLNHNNLWSHWQKKCGAEQISFLKADLQTLSIYSYLVLAPNVFDQINKIYN